MTGRNVDMRRSPRSWLQSLTRMQSWPGRSPAAGANLHSLAEKYYGLDPNRKQSHYLAEYERFLEPLRTKPIRLLELGVRDGASMLLWREYLPRATVVGIDMDAMPTVFPSEARFHFLQGSQDDEAVLRRAIDAAGGPFDLIVDDCSHVGHLSARSFAYLFRNGLRDGGLYVLEDICAAFLPHFPDYEPFSLRDLGPSAGVKDFPNHQNGMIGLMKQIMDHVMAPTVLAVSPYKIETLTVRSNIALVRKGV
jgi:hypothetical protein